MKARMRVRVLAALVTAIAGLALSELGSWLAFYLIDAKPFSYARLRASREARISLTAPGLLGAGAPQLPPVAAKDAVAGRPESTPSELVAHPFLGFTYDPLSRILASMQGRGAMALNEHGFFVLPREAFPGQGPPLHVGLFGGSVAVFAAVDGRAELAAALRENPAWRERPIQLDILALGGFRQPQMAAALGYMQALGERYDLVLELDGFNDVALPFMDWKGKGAFPAYPRGWDALVGGVPDLERQRRIGLVAYLEQRRAALARHFERRPLRWSTTASLLWRTLDGRLEQQLGLARAQLANAGADAGRRYVGLGPQRSFASDAQLLEHLAGLWANSSRQMRWLSEGAGGQYFHFLQPNQYVPGAKPMGAAERAQALSPDNFLRVPVEAGYPLLRREAQRLRAEGLHFTDLSLLFEHEQAALYVDTCCHVSAEGSRRIGRAMGQAVTREATTR